MRKSHLQQLSQNQTVWSVISTHNMDVLFSVSPSPKLIFLNLWYIWVSLTKINKINRILGSTLCKNLSFYPLNYCSKKKLEEVEHNYTVAFILGCLFIVQMFRFFRYISQTLNLTVMYYLDFSLNVTSTENCDSQ